ncbi:hypothetical protein [Mesorhizobium retamae]|uniref:Uncharacterized protein n=1 Tax=Mesorhizobium retamae TaxID=2912854 RepID=A0ABS9QD60_9HYPH|nr:hypothetical protein [Mesorhizobium sp. IRAMC:0171]MCG7505351.1 hypothetical protein [Mesorhizobium sp. IRAMC:0171]
MFDPRVGMKIYDNAWYLGHELEPEEAADVLSTMGVTYVLAQSRLLPMQDTAIESIPTALERARFETLDDRKFRDALQARGIAYFASLNVGFDPKYIATHPELLPIDQFGQREEKADWYIALPPDRREFMAYKIGLLKKAVAALEPDGVHLGFIRWPGFWEIWLPDVERGQMPDYSYDRATLGRFYADTGIDVVDKDPATAARLLAQEHRSGWRDWKCSVTTRAVGSIRNALRTIKPDVKIAINTLPFFLDDFDNAVEEVFGQSPARLAEVSDVFEVMAYHQILRRDASWPGQIASDIKRRSQKTTVCTIQGNALYLEGMHAGRGRAEKIETEEFLRAVDGVEASAAEGICVFTFTDFLDMRKTSDGLRRIDRLRAFRR